MRRKLKVIFRAKILAARALCKVKSLAKGVDCKTKVYWSLVNFKEFRSEHRCALFFSITFIGALEILKTEVNPISKPLLASPEYRRNIALALFYRVRTLFVWHFTGDKIVKLKHEIMKVCTYYNLSMCCKSWDLMSQRCCDLEQVKSCEDCHLVRHHTVHRKKCGLLANRCLKSLLNYRYRLSS